MSTLGGATKTWIEVALLFEADDCLLWPFALHPKGYPTAGDANGVFKPTRRVCEMAFGPAPSPKHHAAHLCGNRSCLNKRHLVWATPKENEAHKKAHGTYYITPRKVSDEGVRYIRDRHTDGVRLRDLAEKFGVSYQAIKKIVTRQSYKQID